MNKICTYNKDPRNIMIAINYDEMLNLQLRSSQAGDSLQRYFNLIYQTVIVY